VNQTLTTITVAPLSASIQTNLTQQFTASAVDQFNRAMTPTFAWSVSGGGVISTTGLFTAGSTAGGPFTVTATSGGRSGTATVTVTAAPNTAPTVATPASGSPNPVTGTTTNLTVLGADTTGGEAALTYTWATTGTPPAAVSFSVNGTNAAKNTTATFTRAGTYNFLVTIRDAGNLTVTSVVSVIVNQTLTTITVAPLSASIQTNLTQQFTASAVDQFNRAMTPTFAWSVSGGGVISPTGLFTAGGSAGGPFTVTATSGGRSGTATVTVTAAPNTAPTISNISDRVIMENTTSGTIGFTIGDAETPAGNLMLSVGSNNPTLVPLSGISLGGAGTNRTVQVTPAASRSGQATITIVVSDGALSASSAFLLTVLPAENPVENQPPHIANIPNQTTEEGTPLSVPIQLIDSDTPANELIVWGQSSNTSLLPHENIEVIGTAEHRTLVLTPGSGQAGTTTITVTVSDGTSHRSANFVLTVIARTAPVSSLPRPEMAFLPFTSIFNPIKGEILTVRFVMGDNEDGASVSLDIRDRNGNVVTNLSDQTQSSGNAYQANWDGRNQSRSFVAAGTYVVVLKNNGKVLSTKVVVVK
jgi:hypothetical protein